MFDCLAFSRLFLLLCLVFSSAGASADSRSQRIPRSGSLGAGLRERLPLATGFRFGVVHGTPADEERGARKRSTRAAAAVAQGRGAAALSYWVWDSHFGSGAAAEERERHMRQIPRSRRPGRRGPGTLPLGTGFRGCVGRSATGRASDAREGSMLAAARTQRATSPGLSYWFSFAVASGHNAARGAQAVAPAARACRAE